jgi:hypothetical protein
MSNQFEAFIVIAAIEFIADFALSGGASFEKQVGSWGSLERRWYQAAFFEEVIELEKDFFFAKVLEREKFVNSGCVISVIDAETDVITHDAPRALGKFIYIVPALLDRSAAIKAVLINVHRGAFKLDYGTDLRFSVCAKDADCGVCLSSVYKVFLLEVPQVFTLGEESVTEGIAKDIFAELALDSCFFHFVEFAAGFNVGPFADYLVGILGLLLKEFFRFLLKKIRQEKWAETAGFAVAGFV